MSVALGVAGNYWVYQIDTRENRHVNGLCTHCGYDLCASPERCPECGAAVAAAR